MTTPRVSTLLPWLYVPLLWFLSFHITPPTGWGWTFNAVLLFIPLGAWLGERYGARGVQVTLLGVGLAWLPLRLSLTEHVGFSSEPAVYVLALAAAFLASGRRSLATLDRALRSRWSCWVLILLLPVSLGLGTMEIIGISASVAMGLTLCFFVALVLAGRAQVEWSVLLLPGIALAISAALHGDTGGRPILALDVLLHARSVELPVLGAVQLNSVFLGYLNPTVVTFVWLFAFFGIGRSLARLEAGHASAIPAPWLARHLVFLFVFLGAGGLLLASIGEEIFSADVRFLRTQLDEPVAVMLGAFVGGLWLGRSGVLLALAVGLACHTPPWGGMQSLWDTTIVILAFGWSGIIYRRLAGVPGNTVPTGMTFRLCVLATLILSGLVPEERWEELSEAEGVAFLGALVLAFIGIVLARRWWLRQADSLKLTAHNGWLALAALAAIVSTAVTHLEETRELLKSLLLLPMILRSLPSGDWNEESSLVLATVGLTLLLLWGILRALDTALRNLGRCWREARVLSSRLAELLGYAALARRVAPSPEIETTTTGGEGKPPSVWLSTLLLWSRRVVAGLGGVMTLTLLIGLLRLEWSEWRSVSGERTYPTEASVPATRLAHPLLLAAAEEFCRPLAPLMNGTPGYPAMLKTGWHSPFDRPTERRRYRITVADTLDSYSLNVEAFIQQRRYGLWLVPSSAGGLDPASREAQRVRALILARARELAGLREPLESTPDQLVLESIIVGAPRVNRPYRKW